MVAEMEKPATELLKEEVALQAAVAAEGQRHMSYSIGEAKRHAVQFQKEVDKCNTAIEACEEGRERVEVATKLEKKATAMWEMRARQVGWTDPV